MVTLAEQFFSHVKECIGMEFPSKTLIEVSYQLIYSKHYIGTNSYLHSCFFYHLFKDSSMAMLNTTLRNLMRKDHILIACLDRKH